MDFALSTRWNASRHTDGAVMIEEILELGIARVELGYDLRMDLVPGVMKMLSDNAVVVDSVHNYCPVPVGAPRGHPELFTFASLDSRTRESAVHHTTKTVRFAAQVGAKVVIVHAGNVEMNRITPKLYALHEAGRQFDPAYEKLKLKLQIGRDRKVGKQIDALRQCLDLMAPVLQETGILLALENLPTWESIPSETEMETLCRDYASQNIRCWHDVGHAQIRQNMGFINQERWLERLSPYLAGMHIHDVQPPAADHLMPPDGKVDFAQLRRFGRMDILRVIEPAPRTPREKIVQALDHLQNVWGEDANVATTEGLS